MFFKKKEAANSAQNPSPQVQDAPGISTQDASLVGVKEPAAPVYQKPVLRRYDQIDQVKPYGPSEI